MDLILGPLIEIMISTGSQMEVGHVTCPDKL